MKEIVLLGKLESKYLFDRYDDPNVEVFSMNKHFDEQFLDPRIKWFDLHINPDKEDADYTIDNFPFEECNKLMGRRFCTTMAYLIAFAILQKAEKISIYGCRFTPDGNSRRERELHNVREWICYALGKGIIVEICEEDKEYLFPEHIVQDNEDFDQ